MVRATSGATGPYCVASSPPPSPAQKRKPACEQAPQRKAHSVAGLTSMSLSRLGFSELETVRQSSELPAARSVFSTETGAKLSSEAWSPHIKAQERRKLSGRGPRPEWSAERA